MRSVNVAELRNRLSKYLTFAKGGEEVVVRDRNFPVAKLVPFPAGGADDRELMLVAAGKMRLPKDRLDIKKLLKIPTGKVAGNKAIQAVSGTPLLQTGSPSVIEGAAPPETDRR